MKSKVQYEMKLLKVQMGKPFWIWNPGYPIILQEEYSHSPVEFYDYQNMKSSFFID